MGLGMRLDSFLTGLIVLCGFNPLLSTTIQESWEGHQMNVEQIEKDWPRDGEADLTINEDEMHFKNRPKRQFTLWCPRKIDGPFRLTFDCYVPEKKTRILILFYAMPNDGSPIRDWESDAGYFDYTTRMQNYTLGINRGPHSGTGQFSPFDLVKGRDDLSNLRRLGLFGYSREHQQKQKQELTELRKTNPAAKVWSTPTWDAWNSLSTLCSAKEPVSGLNTWIHHEIRCEPPHIAYYVNHELVFEVVDHHDKPLTQGYIGFRNMSQRKKFRLRNISFHM